MTTSTPSLSVIIFAYDEEENISVVLGELRSFLEQHESDAEVIFVDDGSRDGTSREAARALEGFRHKIQTHHTNRGIGAALKTGTAHAEAPWITFLPADGQISPHAIRTLRQEARITGADVVFSTYDGRNDGIVRKALSLGVRTLIFAVHGVRMKSDGPYLFRRELFDPEQLKSDSFFLNFEFPIRVMASGLSAAFVEIPCRPRHAGHSKSANLSRTVRVARELLDLRKRRTEEIIRRNIGM